MLKHFICFSSIIFLFILNGCGSAANEQAHEPNDANHEDHSAMGGGDIQEVTANASKLPAFLDNKPEDMRTIYAAVAHHGELLQYIPCYCGCGASAGHKNNDNCFIKERKKDGSIVWDDHGTKCQICLNIAAAAMVDYQNGKSIKEIRTKIDEQYKKGFAEPTPTPMPSDEM